VKREKKAPSWEKITTECAIKSVWCQWYHERSPALRDLITDAVRLPPVLMGILITLTEIQNNQRR
jgi:hypothetical protein